MWPNSPVFWDVKAEGVISVLLGPLDLDNEGTPVLRNVGSFFLPNDTA